MLNLSRIHPWVFVEAFLLAFFFFLTAAAAHADIIIGLPGPMTGSNAGIGVQLRTGAEAAVADINRRGGVLGQRLALRVEDDGCNPVRGLAIAQKLVEDEVKFVLGHFCSATTLPASSIYADAGAIEITFSSNTKITQQGFDGLFRIGGRDDRQGQLLADFLAQQHPRSRVALVADRSAYAVGLADALRSAIGELHLVTLAADLSIDAGQADFSAQIGEIQRSNSQVVVYVGYALDAAHLVTQAKAAGVTAAWVGTNNLADRGLWATAGAAAEGLAFTFLPAADQLATAADVVAELRGAGKTTEGYTLYAYAAVQLLAASIDQAHAAVPEAVAAALQRGDIPTVLGPISFDDDGDNTLPSWRVYRWHDGNYAYYQYSPQSVAAEQVQTATP